MSRLLYIANVRLPTEKAHGLQIVQNCEAFADAGADVSLWAARRANTPAMRAVRDIWAHYGVRRNFSLSRLPCLDLLPLVSGRADWLARLAFTIQRATFAAMAFLRVLFVRADVYYSRDLAVIAALSLVKPRRALACEIHALPPSRASRFLLRLAIRRSGSLIAITPQLKAGLVEMGADPERALVAHDGVRRERFASLPSQAEAREALGWPRAAFVVGYVGQLHTMAMDKGVDGLIEALARVHAAGQEDIALALVGGPDEMAEHLRRRWLDLGLDGARFLCAGQVAPERVPLYLSAFDVCAMPHPWTEHFAYATSPLKLFEYMASGRAVLASDLPGWADVIADGETALLVPPGDVDALAAAIRRLITDPALRARLAAAARETVMARYTWDARAQAILTHIVKVEDRAAL